MAGFLRQAIVPYRDVKDIVSEPGPRQLGIIQGHCIVQGKPCIPWGWKRRRGLSWLHDFMLAKPFHADFFLISLIWPADRPAGATISTARSSLFLRPVDDHPVAAKGYGCQADGSAGPCPGFVSPSHPVFIYAGGVLRGGESHPPGAAAYVALAAAALEIAPSKRATWRR
jgi:hypothetical protein